MAITQNTFTGNGSNLGPFSFTFKWLEPTDIKVTVGGVLKTAGTHYNLQALNYTTKDGGQVLFTAGNAPANNATIRVYRDTDDNALSATFFSGSAIRAQDLNDDFTQNLYSTQEVKARYLDRQSGEMDVAYVPSTSTDVVTKGYMESNYGIIDEVGFTRWRQVATAGQTTFSGGGSYGNVLSFVPNREQVYLNGALQQINVDYTASTTGTSITFSPGLTVGDVVDVVCINNLVQNSTTSSDDLDFVQAGTGAVTRSIGSKLRDVVSVKDFGAVGDGVTDDTAAIQAGLASLRFGQSLLIPSDCRCRITSTITVPKGCSLLSDSTGWKGYANNRGNDGNPDFYAISPAIHVDSGAGILLAAGASIANLLIIKRGLTFPVTQAQAAAFTGTAIQSAGNNVSVQYCTIFGFEIGIRVTSQRPLIEGTNIDCYNGVEVTTNYDAGFIVNNHLWPFLTAYWLPVATNDDLKRNIGFYLHDVSDWTSLSNNYCYGYSTGFKLLNVSAVSLVNCGADNITPAVPGYHVGSTGFHIEGSTRIKLVNCNVAAQETGVYVNNTSTSTVVISNLAAWSNVVDGLLLDAGTLTISNSLFEAAAAGTGSGIKYNDATGAAHITASNITFKDYSGSKIPVNIAQNVTTNRLVISGQIVINCSSPAIRGSGSYTIFPVASAGSTVLPAYGDLFVISGTTNIGNFVTETWTGRRITLVFQGALTLVNSTALRLAGSVNATTTALSSMSFVYHANSWVETARSFK